VVCSMLHFSSGDMVRSLKFGSLCPPWQKSITETPAPVRPTSSSTALDMVHIDGGLNKVWTPASRAAAAESTLHVLVNFTVSFTLTAPLDVECIKAKFEGNLNIQFTEAVPFLRIEWMLWDQGLLPAGKRYEFEVVAEIPSTAPCSMETRLGGVDYTLVLWVEGLRDRCMGPRIVTKAVTVLNPYLVFDVPRVNLEVGVDQDLELIGATVDVTKDVMAFVRYPDQFVTGNDPHHCDKSLPIGPDFPLEISFPSCSEDHLSVLTSITISIIQQYIYIIPIEGIRKRITEKTPISERFTILPSTAPKRLSIPLSGPIMGRFTAPRFRICHSLRIIFHRPFGRRKVKWDWEIEIFEPNVECEIQMPRSREFQMRRLSGRGEVQEVEQSQEVTEGKKTQ
jgi:hypothetical protein